MLRISVNTLVLRQHSKPLKEVGNKLWVLSTIGGNMKIKFVNVGTAAINSLMELRATVL